MKSALVGSLGSSTILLGILLQNPVAGQDCIHLVGSTTFTVLANELPDQSVGVFGAA